MPAVADHLTCIKCGYDLRGLPPDGVCPECATPVAQSRDALTGPFAPRRWIVSVRDGITMLILAALASATSVFFYAEVVQVSSMAISLFPPVVSCCGVWFITRAAAGGRDPVPWWLRWPTRLAALSVALLHAAFFPPLFRIDIETRDLYRIIIAVTSFATAMLYAQLAIVARRQQATALLIQCVCLAIAMPATLVAANVWRLAMNIGFWKFSDVLKIGPIVGVGFPQALRSATELGQNGTLAQRSMPSILALLLFAAWAIAVLGAMRHRLNRELMKAA